MRSGATIDTTQASLFDGAVIGTLIEIDAEGLPRVEFPGNFRSGGCEALTSAVLALQDVGRRVVLVFDRGEPGRPIVIGVIRPAEPAPGPARPAMPGRAIEARMDGETLVLEASRDMILRCGKASIQLTRDGKIVIRGADLLSRSSGGNRIKGATVRIN